MKIKSTLMVLLAVVALTTTAIAQSGDVYVTAVDTDTAISVSATPTTTTTTQRVVVKSMNSYRFLRDGDQEVVDSYLAKYRPHLRQGNYDFLRSILPQLVGNGTIDARDSRGKLRLLSRPVDYIRMGQTLCGDLTGTVRFVDVPAQKIPPFVGGGSQGPLVLDAVPEVEQPRAITVCAAPPPGALSASHSGSINEVPVASGWKSWREVPQLPAPVVCKPDPETPETCDPNGSPPPKPPTSAPVGDPSWIEPTERGWSAEGGPPPPTGDQAPVVIGDPSVTWEPSLTHPNVADPVVDPDGGKG